MSNEPLSFCANKTFDIHVIVSHLCEKKNKTMVLNKSEFFLMQHRSTHAASLAFACSCRYVAPGLNQSDGLPGHPSQFFFRPGATDRQLIRLLTSKSYCNLTGSFKLS